MCAQELLRSHGLLEEEGTGAATPEERKRRRERLMERHQLHQLKRDHDLQEGSRRKVLRLEERAAESSGSDEETAGRSGKDQKREGQSVDIQVRVYGVSTRLGRKGPPLST